MLSTAEKAKGILNAEKYIRKHLGNKSEGEEKASQDAGIIEFVTQVEDFESELKGLTVKYPLIPKQFKVTANE